MASDSNGQPVGVGETVIIRATVHSISGDTLHLVTSEKTNAYPDGTRINVTASQVERVVVEPEEPESTPVSSDPVADETWADLSKAQIVEKAKTDFNAEIDPKLNRAKMLEVVKNLIVNAQQGNAASA